jgi:hypothetical protein
VAASAYIDPVIDPSGPLTAADIETVSRKPAGRLGRDRIRKRLYTKGFPHPFERGLWSAKAVPEWLASAGGAEHMGVARLNACDRFPLFGLSVDRSIAAPKTLAGLKPRSLGKWRARRDSNS